MREMLFKIPFFVATVVIMSLVAYLTLFPDPVPEMSIMIPYADKIVHFLMFFAVAACWLFDLRRVYRKYSIAFTVVISCCYGGFIELAQMWMEMGRSADWFDFVADCVGVVTGTWFCYMFLFKKS